MTRKGRPPSAEERELFVETFKDAKALAKRKPAAPKVPTPKPAPVSPPIPPAPLPRTPRSTAGLDGNTAERAATILYETNSARPNPFRAEYPLKLATLAAWRVARLFCTPGLGHRNDRQFSFFTQSWARPASVYRRWKSKVIGLRSGFTTLTSMVPSAARE